jgi:excisionase family DNA binding protein
MIALTIQTAAAVALHAAEGSWVMFLMVSPIPNALGPIKIEGIKGKHIPNRLRALALDNPYEVKLIGLLPTQLPDEDAHEIANEFGAYQIHDWWFEPSLPLQNFISTSAQDELAVLIGQTQAGALDETVDIEQIAQLLGVSVPTVRRLIKAEKIPCFMQGKAYRFVVNDVMASLGQ